jgi:hypothetical protein
VSDFDSVVDCSGAVVATVNPKITHDGGHAVTVTMVDSGRRRDFLIDPFVPTAVQLQVIAWIDGGAL